MGLSSSWKSMRLGLRYRTGLTTASNSSAGRSPVVDVERVHAERRHREVPRLAAARRTRDHDHPRTRHSDQPVSTVVSDSGRMSGGSSFDTRLPPASMTPNRSRRARSAAILATAMAITRRSHSSSSSGRSRSRSSNGALGIGDGSLACECTEEACPIRAPSTRTSEDLAVAAQGWGRPARASRAPRTGCLRGAPSDHQSSGGAAIERVRGRFRLARTRARPRCGSKVQSVSGRGFKAPWTTARPRNDSRSAKSSCAGTNRPISTYRFIVPKPKDRRKMPHLWKKRMA